MTVLICRTCPRYDRRASGRFADTFRRALQVASTDHGAPVTTRTVQCLGGCPDDGVVALDDRGKPRVRFTALDDSDAAAVLAAAGAYDDSATGVPGDWQVPPALIAHLSSVTRKFTTHIDA